MQIQVSDFRAIRSAEVDLKGLTLITGKNSNGKSTLLKALRAALDNNSNDNCYRRGTRSFQVTLKVMNPKSGAPYSVTYQRESASTSYTDNNTSEVFAKLNKASLQEAVPAFPLKVFKFKDSKFYPNIVFQNEIPLFSQVDIYELLSGMFQSVSKLLKYRDDSKTEASLATTKLQAERATVEFTQAQLGETVSSLSDYDIAAVSREYSALQKAEKELAECSELQVKQITLDASIKATATLAWADQLDLAEVEKTLGCIQHGYEKLQKIKKLSDDISLLGAQIKEVPNFADVDLAAVTAYLKTLGDIPEPQVIPTFIPTEAFTMYSRLGKLCSSVLEEEKALGLAGAGLLEYQEKLKGIQTCPLCGTDNIHLHGDFI